MGITLLLILGFAMVIFASFVWMGLPIFILALLKGEGNLRQAVKLSAFSMSSIPVILESRTVYEFIQTLPDQAKAAAFNDIMSNMRKLLLDIKKHRATYPADIEGLKLFVLSQLRFNIERSPARSSLETAKFRELAELFVLTEVMQDIYMADCKASREAAYRNIRK